MPYTRTWDETVPPGSAARNTVATIFRNFKVDLRERFETGLIEDFEADPVVVKPAVLGNVTGKLLNVHWSAFNFTGGSSGSAGGSGSYVTFGDSTTRYAPLILPPGAVITEVTFYGDANGAGSITCNVVRSLRSSGIMADVFSDVSVFTAYNGATTGPVSHTVDGLYTYALRVEPNSSNRLYSVTVEYDVADSRITI